MKEGFKFQSFCEFKQKLSSEKLKWSELKRNRVKNDLAWPELTLESKMVWPELKRDRVENAIVYSYLLFLL